MTEVPTMSLHVTIGLIGLAVAVLAFAVGILQSKQTYYPDDPWF